MPDRPADDPIERHLEATRAARLDSFQAFLRIPSISALPDHAPDVRRAADWLADALRDTGLEHVEVAETGGHPVVYADWLHAEGAPTVLVYGHYDVQPVDPLDLWTSPPFEPAVVDGRMLGRGSAEIPVAFAAMADHAVGGVDRLVECCARKPRDDHPQ